MENNDVVPIVNKYNGAVKTPNKNKNQKRQNKINKNRYFDRKRLERKRNEKGYNKRMHEFIGDLTDE